MRTLIVAVLAASLASLAWAQASDRRMERRVRIATGQKGKTYNDVYGARMLRLLPEYDVKFRLTDGSRDNVELIAAGDVELAFAQADVYAASIRQDPDRYANIRVIGQLADECLYIAYNVKGPVLGFEDLKKGDVGGRAPTVAVGPAEGGAEETWSHLTTIEPGLAGVNVDSRGGSLALNHLEGGVIDAVAWVTDPRNYDHPMLAAVQANDGLELMGVNDPKLALRLPGGQRIYAIKDIRLDPGFFDTGLFADRLDTVCTVALVLARKDANPVLLDRVSDIVSLQRDELTGRD